MELRKVTELKDCQLTIFAGSHHLKDELLDGPAKYASMRGAAKWAERVLARGHITFKMCSRNVVMTKLANSTEISEYDAATHMKVIPRTMRSYHCITPGAHDKASRILNEPVRRKVSTDSRIQRKHIFMYPQVKEEEVKDTESGMSPKQERCVTPIPPESDFEWDDTWEIPPRLPEWEPAVNAPREPEVC